MMFLHWALRAPVSLSFNLFVMLTAPIWAAWAAIGNLDRLPGIFALVHTHDETIYGLHIYGPKPATMLGRFRRAVIWLWRNPGYGLDSTVLGFSEPTTLIKDTNPAAQFDGGVTTSRFVVRQLPDGSKRWTYRRDQVLFGRRWAKIYLGWTLTPYGGRYMIKVMVNPLRTHQ